MWSLGKVVQTPEACRVYLGTDDLHHHHHHYNEHHHNQQQQHFHHHHHYYHHTQYHYYVFLGSFWDQPLKLEDNRVILEREKQDLISEMMSLPQNAVVRRINELVKRARSVKVHAFIIHYLKKQMPLIMGKKYFHS
jgi:hypothetical protein